MISLAKFKKITPEQKLLIKRVISGKPMEGDKSNIRNQPWVIIYLLKMCEKEKSLPIIKKVRERIEKEFLKKPEVFSRRIIYPKCPPKLTISVITPSFNNGIFLKDTLRTIANQTFKNFEHIIIDGGSVDETVSILKQHPSIKWTSEKDSGYNEAFGKGLSLARGKYVINCAVSDGFADKNWFKKCVEVLESQPDVSLVWGFPQNLSEEGIPGKISYSQFHLNPAPQKYDFFYFWLRTGHGFPEGNLCVRKNILKKCLTGLDSHSVNCHIWKEFAYNFETMGFLPYHLPVVANYGRAHGGQLSQKDQEAGVEQKLQKNYLEKIAHYRQNLIFGKITHIFRGGDEKTLPVKFSINKLANEYFQDIKKRIKFQFSRFI